MEDSRLVLPALCIREHLRPFLSLGIRYVFTDTDHGFIKSSPYAELSSTKNDAFLKNTTVSKNAIPGKREQAIVSAKSPYSGHGQEDSKTREKPAAASTGFCTEKKNISSQNKSEYSQLKNSNVRQLQPSDTQQPIDTISKDWPEPWHGHWKSIGQCRPVVWTYWELGLDISGRADTRRGMLLRKFNAELKLPSGTNAYWPIAAPDKADMLLANKEIFWAGVERIAPRFAIVCGERALAALAPQNTIAPFSTQFLCNCLVLALPEIMDIVENKEIENKTIIFLQRYLSSLKA